MSSAEMIKVDKVNEELPPAEMRGKILALEETLKALPQAEIPLEHFFAPGIYMRQMTVPKDVYITGKIHKTEHYCILAQGQVTVVTEHGRKTYQAPAVIHSMPGDKRAIHSLTEAVWINVHHNPTNERDLQKIDQIFVAETYEQYLSHQAEKQIQGGV